ncbi:MAG: hypothetical protein ACR2QT_13150 [Woeseiaceae bacterium]
MTSMIFGSLRILTCAALLFGALNAGAAFESVESGPRAKINLIPYDGEMTFFVFDASDICGKRKKGEKLKVKMKTQRESIFVRAGYPTNFAFSFRVMFGKTIHRDFSFTPVDGHEYNIAYHPSIDGMTGFRVTEVGADGSEQEFMVENKLECLDEAEIPYPENPTQVVTIGKDLGESAATVSFIAPGLKGEFLSSTGVRLFAFENGTCDSAEKLVLKPGNRHKAFVMRGGREWQFRVYYDRRALGGQITEAAVDFSFPVESQREYVIEYLHRPFKSLTNFWVVDENGERQKLGTKSEIGCKDD